MKYLLLLAYGFASFQTNAQIINVKETAEQKTQNRANNKVDHTVDKGLDKVEEGIGNLFKKKKKKTGDAGEATEEKATNAADKTGADSKSGSGKPSFTTYSKFDFISGEKVLYYDIFEKSEIGDFPAGWNTNSSAEVVKLDGLPGKWLSMTKDGYFQPEMVTNMPDNFTLEFDVFNRYKSSNILAYHFIIGKSNNLRGDIGEDLRSEAAFAFSWYGCSGSMGYEVTEKGESMGENSGLTSKNLICNGDDFQEPGIAKFSLWRQKNRLRIYINEEKVLDVPQAFNSNILYNVFKWKASKMNFSNGRQYDDVFMVANIKYAVGAPDTRNKLITEGKFSTTGILFDVNSDKIDPSSYGTIKTIADVLKENATVSVKIVGHTDSDGDDKSNLLLSQKRAAAVKQSLTSNFGIDESRMRTDGKGESEPAVPNTTTEGKANNRRVEFIKL